MNKLLREEMEYLITCDDKSITPDVRNDVEMTLNYIDDLENRINAVINDMKHFHLIYDEDEKLISSDKSIFAEIRFFIDKLEGTIPTTMTPFEHGMWEKESKSEDNE